MGTVVKANTFSAGATIVAAEHNANFDDIYNEFNGNIDNSNIKSTAAIVASKLDLTSPNAIGQTTPSTGKFTTLEATTTLKLGTAHQGDVIADDGTSLARVASNATSADYVLTSNGTDTDVTWSQVATGGIADNAVTAAKLGSITGTWNDACVTGTAYQAATTIWLCAYTEKNTNSQQIQMLSDATTNPSTVIQSLYMDPSTNIQLQVGSIIIKDDYWRINTTGTDATIRYLPLG